VTSAIHSRDDTARPDGPGPTSPPEQTHPEPFCPDDTALDLRTPRTPAPGDSDSAHQQILKNVIKAQLFPDHAVPVTIGRFRVLRPLGAGGMSFVYAAYDEKLDRRIALKLLRGGETPDSQPRLLREAQAMARLAHPNVVAVHEVGTWNDQVYVAMEFVKGRDLRTWLAEAPQHHADVVEVFTAAGRGLAAAHHAGIVHRDFKPANVLLGDDGRVRVVDFGLARTGNEQLPDLSHTRLPAPITSLSTSLTMTGALVGTPAYMSPEQHAGRLADARSDQFSFCVALWEGLYGVTPFAGQTLAALAEEVVAGRIAPVPEDSNVPAWLRRVLLRGLAVDPAARWPSMDDLLDELARDPEKLRRARLRVGLVAAGVIAVFLGLAWLAREQADLARLAQRAEAAAEHQRNVAEQSQADAEAQRDLLLADLKIQLAAKESARVELEQALRDADAARLRAEDAGAAAEAHSARADQQRLRAEREAAEAQRQTTRAVQEARRARDATRLSQALGGAQDDPTTVLALLRETEDPAATPGWIPAAVDTLLQPVSQAVLRVHRGTVHAAGFTAGGRRVATAADDHTAALWDWTADTTLTREHPGPVKFLAFGPDDLWVSASSRRPRPRRPRLRRPAAPRPPRRAARPRPRPRRPPARHRQRRRPRPRVGPDPPRQRPPRAPRPHRSCPLGHVRSRRSTPRHRRRRRHRPDLGHHRRRPPARPRPTPAGPSASPCGRPATASPPAPRTAASACGTPAATPLRSSTRPHQRGRRPRLQPRRRRPALLVARRHRPHLAQQAPRALAPSKLRP
jgi:predicted Ser/Thr protein kinase